MPTARSVQQTLRETETDCKQPVLLAHGPRARTAEALAQPQHGFKALDGAPGRVEGLEAPDPRHGPLHPDVIALDPLLEMLGHVMHRRACQQAGFPPLRDCGWVGPHDPSRVMLTTTRACVSACIRRHF